MYVKNIILLWSYVFIIVSDSDDQEDRTFFSMNRKETGERNQGFEFLQSHPGCIPAFLHLFSTLIDCMISTCHPLC